MELVTAFERLLESREYALLATHPSSPWKRPLSPRRDLMRSHALPGLRPCLGRRCMAEEAPKGKRPRGRPPKGKVCCYEGMREGGVDT